MTRRTALLLFVPAAMVMGFFGGCSGSSKEMAALNAATSAQKPTTADLLFSLGGTDQDFETGITALQGADPTSDAAEAMRRSDRRLIGVYGFTLVVPGFDASTDSEIPPGYTVVAIKGTSDAIGSEAQARFQDLLQDYASQYNKRLLAAQ